MKRIKKIPLILTMFLLILMSCSKEWLKPDPLSFYAPENVYVDEAGFESGLEMCRKEMLAEDHGGVNYIATETAYSDIAIGTFYLDATKLTPSGSYYPILTFFNNAFEYIKNANIIISRIDDIKWTDQSIRNRILSEAYWFRAYWDYRMVHDYGDIPWVGNELKGSKRDFYSTTRWAILAQLQKDLEFSVENLPDAPAYLGCVTKGAANHLLAKVYLANCEFDKAITAATSVINGPYALMTDRFGIDVSKGWHDVMWDLHRCENKNLASNTETIYAPVERPSSAPGTWWSTVGTSSMWLYVGEYWRIGDITGARACNWRTTAGDSLGLGNCLVRTNNFFHYWIWNDATYTWKTTPDMRRAPNNWIEMGDTLAEMICNAPGSPNFGQPINKYWGVIDTVFQWYPWPIYKIYTPTPNEVSKNGGEGDWYIFRLAETYLLRAEAYFWKGQTALAADDINKVRQRADAPLITAADVTIDYIFDERARELYIEEPRHAEMVRVSFILGKLNKDGYSLANIANKNWYYDRVMRLNYFYSPPKLVAQDNTANLFPYNMLWPVPQSVITANTLGTINQNYGYDGYENNVAPLETIP